MLFKNKKIQSFFDSTKETAKLNGVKLIISKSKTLKLSNNVRCFGYFQGFKNGKAILKIATGLEESFWFPIFVHESCHMEQWIGNTKEWFSSDKLDIVDEWIGGKEYDKKTVYKSTLASINLELDCEKRTVKKIKKWNLPINTETYIQKANGYVLFYNYAMKKRKWCHPDSSPHRNKMIYSKMPKTWLRDYSKIPKRIEKIFDAEIRLL
jgi:hypothetical protein